MINSKVGVPKGYHYPVEPELDSIEDEVTLAAGRQNG